VDAGLRAFEPLPIPVHIGDPAGRHLPQTTRLFVDQMTGVLREKFTPDVTAR